MIINFLSNRKRYVAFTLAEVLITLGIIGIVASLTIPTIVNDFQKKSYVTHLKKFYATQQDGWQRLLADQGVEQLDDTSVFQSMGQGACMVDEASDENCKPFFDALKKYFNFTITTVVEPNIKIRLLDGEVYDSYVGPVLIFADGSILHDDYFYKTADQSTESAKEASIQAGGKMHSSQGYFSIDVNGLKGPNTYGRDIFEFFLGGDGQIYPRDGRDSSLMDGTLTWTWHNFRTSCGVENSSDITGVEGDGCAARIIEEGWQMSY